MTAVTTEKITISSSVDNLTAKTKYRLIQILGGAEVTLNDGIIEEHMP